YSVQLQAGMQAAAVATKDTMDLPQRTRRTRSTRITLTFVIFVSFVAVRFVPFLAVRFVSFAAQDVSDADLDAASRGDTIRVGVTANGRRPAEIPIETYVARVLAGEGEPHAADAAQQALAVAIRTYTMANLGKHQREGFDLCDTTHCQVMRANATPAS